MIDQRNTTERQGYLPCALPWHADALDGFEFSKPGRGGPATIRSKE